MYRHALGRDPSEAELDISVRELGRPVNPERVADFVWGLTQLPEFAYIE